MFARTPPPEWAEPLSWVYLMLAVRYELYGDVNGDCLRFCETSNPFVVDQFGYGVFVFPQEQELSIKLESKFFWNIS